MARPLMARRAGAAVGTDPSPQSRAGRVASPAVVAAGLPVAGASTTWPISGLSTCRGWVDGVPPRRLRGRRRYRPALRALTFPPARVAERWAALLYLGTFASFQGGCARYAPGARRRPRSAVGAAPAGGAAGRSGPKASPLACHGCSPAGPAPSCPEQRCPPAPRLLATSAQRLAGQARTSPPPARRPLRRWRPRRRPRGCLPWMKIKLRMLWLSPVYERGSRRGGCTGGGPSGR